MNAPAAVLHWGLLLITVPNLIVIGAIIVLFAAALVLPFPHQGTPVQEEVSHEKHRSSL